MSAPVKLETNFVSTDQNNGSSGSIVTQSSAMRQLIREAIRASHSSASILLTGESGTGKELFASIIHEHSNRREKPYVRVNCAALPTNLIESELFGHEKGSFTDAIQQRIGRFEHAHGGTLLLDEVTEIPLTTQAKLLRILEENEVQRVGSNESIHIDVRVVATSNRDLSVEVQSGKFRLDLYHRLNVIEIGIPPLRDRTIDIPLLAMHFVDQFKSENRLDIKGFTKSAMQLLRDYQWPGNIRELRNTVHRACIITDRPLIDVHCLSHLQNHNSAFDNELIPDSWLGIRLAEIEKQVILASISKFGSKRAAADYLGVTTRTLTNKLKLYSEQDSDDRCKAA